MDESTVLAVVFCRKKVQFASMGDALGRPDSENCEHPFSDVSERTVSAYIGDDELDVGATVMFCENCDSIVEVKESGFDRLRYSSLVT